MSKENTPKFIVVDSNGKKYSKPLPLKEAETALDNTKTRLDESGKSSASLKLVEYLCG